MKALAAMLAADSVEFARQSSGGGAAIDVSKMLFQTALREVTITVRALRVPRAFPSSHFSLSDDQPFLHRTNCDENRKLACAFD